MNSFKGIILFLIIISYYSCSNFDVVNSDDFLVIKNVNLITMESDKVISGQGVIIKNSTIDYVGRLEEKMYPKNSKVIGRSRKVCDARFKRYAYAH